VVQVVVPLELRSPLVLLIKVLQVDLGLAHLNMEQVAAVAQVKWVGMVLLHLVLMAEMGLVQV
tara:strand:- start:1182 stop:1370 length:189 start_codon:yes stop_codon:yes gene_type:complete